MTVLALFGPTGVGKTEVAIEVAEILRARGRRPVAVSADALQVYEGLEILTGAASPEEQRRLEHRMVSVIPVTETFSVAEYARRAHAEIDDIINDGGVPIVVGGTGLYLRAALAQLDLKPPPEPGVREALMERLHQQGAQQLHDELARAAPATAAAIDPNDRHRIVRALELAAQGALTDGNTTNNQLWTQDTRLPTRLIALTMDRDLLKSRIDARVDAMVAAGARAQVLHAEQLGASATARKAVGYQELLAGEVDTMKTRTRQYARRQLTWLRKLPGVEHVDLTGRTAAEAAAEIVGGT
ncbi:tRNA (adenosine(37)-N6)-dimethylallyltransferase MiaA [Conexibacter woesei]|uniref:tRNA (adenosine(37)-N6)-dimethylallyltransferase MiaA n=1 Tax=Conexibacter woesei TaxID=191495 RepID=UPI000414206B|nr:tRNA (adenosine(37)-N6)-dimethylallyltransferase MiaA [Conexibacter woesei]